MKKSIVLVLSLLAIMSFGISACQFGIVQNDSNNEDVVNTMVALAFTQTAIAESETQEPVVVETAAPPEVDETTTEDTEAPRWKLPIP